MFFPFYGYEEDFGRKSAGYQKKLYFCNIEHEKG